MNYTNLTGPAWRPDAALYVCVYGHTERSAKILIDKDETRHEIWMPDVLGRPWPRIPGDALWKTQARYRVYRGRGKEREENFLAGANGEYRVVRAKMIINLMKQIVCPYAGRLVPGEMADAIDEAFEEVVRSKDPNPSADRRIRFFVDRTSRQWKIHVTVGCDPT
jgi:hypothetical protein